MDQLLQDQLQVKDAIRQLQINFKKDGQDRKTSEHIKRRQDTLEMYWEEFEKNHEKLCAFENRAHDYFFENHYEETRTLYTDTKKLIQKTASPPSQPPKKHPVAQPNPETSLGSGRRQDESSDPPNIPHDFISRGSHSKLDEMLRKQASNFKALSRTLSNIKIDSVAEKWELQDILRSLDSRWAAIDLLHWEIDSELNGTDEHYEDTFTKYENQYLKMKKEINSKLWSASHREQATPRLDIPVFHGNYQQWVSFKDLFKEAIHANPSLSNAQKMQFLKSKIKGEPERLIQHLPISSDNYVTCWEILNNRYNNKSLIFTTHINTMMSLPVMQQATSSHVKRLHDVTIESLNGVKNLGINIDTWDPILVHIVTQKLDSETHNEYLTTLKQPRELPSLRELLSFLESKFTAMESSRRKQDTTAPRLNTNRSMNPGHQVKSNHFKQYYSSNKATSNTAPQVYRRRCQVCQNDHGIYFCTEFKNMVPGLKRKTVENLNLCINCLYSHNGKQCNSAKRCQECSGSHNTLLHDAFYNQNAASRNTFGNTRKIPFQQGNGSHAAQQRDENNEEPKILLATAIIKVQGADGQPRIMRALIDQGSQISLISENAAHKLGLPRQKCKGVITGVGTNDNTCRGSMNLNCNSTTEDYAFHTDVFIMKSLTRNLPNSSFTKPTWDFLEIIPLADSQFYTSNPIDLLLGAEVYANILLKGMKKHESSPLIAQETRLGWILCGKIQGLQCNLTLHNTEEIQRFWEIEDIPKHSTYSSDEDECVNIYNSTTKRLNDGRYQVRLPLKSTYLTELGQSKRKSIAQFLQLERKFSRNENIAQQYKQFIHEYLSHGHMKLTSALVSNKIPECYLPHSCVLREESTTSPLRVVFNASSKTSNGTSLNDFMHKGPNLQKDLLTLVLKWRQHRVAFIADIEKMFRQIWVHEDDQKLQKIIWRDSPHEMLQEYQLTTVTYGTKAAPFLAMMTLKKLAKDERSNYPEAAQVLEECFYMDDLLHGSHSVASAKKLQQDLKQLLWSGGFNLRKWMSNNQELLQAADKEGSTPEVNYNFKEHESRKTLGLNWNPTQDFFNFQSRITPFNNEDNESNTKRQLLSDISKLFDPLGWLTPVSTKLKLLFQQLWNTDIQWDEKIPHNINTEWLKIKLDLHNINQIQIPRWLGTEPSSDIELHAFCDSSEKSYACVIYCKTKYQEQTQIVLLAAKSRLVPNNKEYSMTKLELCGALLLSQLMEKIMQSFTNHNTKIYGWTDSTAVLGWLQGDPNRWKVFVANRVRQITQVIPPQSWRYVKSADNPADSASRGLTASQLKQHRLWWQGPTWLSSFKDEAQKSTLTYTTEEETKIVKQVNIVISNQSEDSLLEFLLNKYSSFSKILRVLAWVRRFITQKQDRQTEKYITLSELRKAKTVLQKHVQKTVFETELTDLKKSGKVSPKSKISQLSPIIDKEGILRVGGRLENAQISYDMKHPIILPHKNRLTELIIDHAHKTTLHGGARITLNFIRNKYWIIGGNQATKQYIRRCVTCKKQKPDKHLQIMGDLPAARSNPSRPFTHTGVDYTGHVIIKANKGRGIKTTKGYVAVFVCMVTKAVHLELVSDLTTSAFIAALRRMAARRGTPTHMYSDNGRNFLGASNVLQYEQVELHKIMDEEFMTLITDMEIKWHFNAPLWASAGGLWESCVKSLKFHLKRVIGAQKLTFEEFSTLLAQIEGCLNSRPLCAISEDPEDLNYLTPSHFLASGPSLTIIETEKDLRTRWQLTQKIFQDLWKRWRLEYLAQLNARSKWRTPQVNIKINDVVLLHDDNLPPGKWVMGRVTQLHPGRDGFVRVVSLKTKNGILKRPIVKISVLLEHKEDELPNKRLEDNQNQNSLPKYDDNSKRAHLQTRAKKNKFHLTSMFAALILFLSLATRSECNANVTSFKESQSLYFDRVSDMMIIRDEWKLVVYYNMAPYWQATNAFRKYTLSLTETCETIKKQVHCDVISLQLSHGFSELEYYNQMLLSQHTSTRPETLRHRRGLIDGIGYVANSLFGVLDERFAEQYQKDISLIRNNAKHMVTLWKNQTSIVEAQYNLLKRSEEKMNQQHKLIHQHLNKLEEAVSNIRNKLEANNVINDFTVGAIIASNMLNNLKEIQNTLLDTITDIYHGRFNLHLLTPEQLISELSTIASKLPRDVSLPIENIHSDLRKIYQLLNVKTRMLEEVLIFEIRLPLISRDTFEIFKIISNPKVDGDKMVSVEPVSNYVSINMKKDSYIPMSGNDVRSCTLMSEAYFCPIKKPIYQIKGDKSFCKIEKSECKTKITTCENNWQESYTPNAYIYFCCERCQVRTMCADQVTAYQLTNAGLINVGHGCIVKTVNFTVYPHKPHWSEVRMQPEVYVPLMAPINHIINITIPHTRELEEEGSQDIQNEMRNIGEKIKILKKTELPSESEELSYHDIHHYAMIYLMFGVVALAGLTIVLRRVQCSWRVPRSPPPNTQEPEIGADTPPPRATPRNTAQNTASTGSEQRDLDDAEAKNSRVDKGTTPKFRPVSFN